MTRDASYPRLYGLLQGGPVERAIADGLLRISNARLEGLEHLPASGCLLVGNHAAFGLDALLLGALLVRETGRTPRWLAERILFLSKLTAAALDAVGAIPGAPEPAIELLKRGEMVVVYPGGIDDSFKLGDDAYRLKWGERTGFARVALAAGVPIVPIAATGVDEIFDVVGYEPGLGKLLFGSTRYNLPLLRSLIPRKVECVFHVRPPLEPEGSAADPSAAERLRDRTRASLEAVLEPYRAAHPPRPTRRASKAPS
jgi:1-acyl-sn-glycerol-3-phosphate acyltransferase